MLGFFADLIDRPPRPGARAYIVRAIDYNNPSTKWDDREYF